MLGAGVAAVLSSGHLRTWLLTTLVAAATTTVSGWIGSVFAKAPSAIGAAAGQQPITVTVRGPFGDEWMVPATAAELPVAREMITYFDDWAAEHDGMLISPYELEILVEGRSAQAVVLRAMRVIIDSRRPANDGIRARTVGWAGGLLIPRGFALDLGEGDALLRPVNSPWNDAPTPPFPYSVSQGDPELFHLSVSTSEVDCLWRLEIDWTADGIDGTYRIDDGGKPFRIACGGRRRAYVFDVNHPQAGWTVP
jgi:hypothetical protein